MSFHSCCISIDRQGDTLLINTTLATSSVGCKLLLRARMRSQDLIAWSANSRRLLGEDIEVRCASFVMVMYDRDTHTACGALFEELAFWISVMLSRDLLLLSESL